MEKLKLKENNIIGFMSVLITFYKLNQNVNIENHDNFIYLSKILDLILNICLEKNNF